MLDVKWQMVDVKKHLFIIKNAFPFSIIHLTSH